MENRVYTVHNESQSIKDALEEYLPGSEYDEETELLAYEGKHYYADRLDVVGCVDSLHFYKLILDTE